MLIKLCFIIVLLSSCNKSDCLSLADRDSPLEVQTDAMEKWNQNILRVIRQTLGYPSSVQPRDQTVIVVPNGGSSLPTYRGVPSTYGVNRAPTVVVNVPDDTYYPTAIGRRYIGNSNGL